MNVLNNNRWARRSALALVALALLAGGLRAEDTPPVAVPEDVVIPVGGTTDFTVTIDREVLEGKATVELRGLPEGVKAMPGTLEVEKKAKTFTVTLLGAGDLPADQEHEVTVVVRAGDAEEEAKFTLHTEDYTPSGTTWLIMLVSVGAVLLLVSFCLVRVLTLPPTEEETLKGPLEIDTGDTGEADDRIQQG